MNSRLAAAADLLRRGAPIDGEMHVGTALHWAAHLGRAEAVRFLLHEGADVTIRDRASGGTAAGWAQQAGHAELEQLLGLRVAMSASVSLNAPGRTPG